VPLRWHYRSRHESLITFSNYRFYDGKLITFPSAVARRDDLGVGFHHVAGQYRRGGPRDNPVEAQTVAELVRLHAARPEPPSIGVVAFSHAQAETIQNAIDQMLTEHPELEEALGGDRLRRYFVKNLENVQGDERDVMIFSVGYGPDEAGKLTLNFGPLNKEGGWRRLNVAITRARERVELVASFTSRELDTRGSSNRGVRELQRYLDYAERGYPALAIDLGQSGGDLESPLEQSVHAALVDWGLDVVPQVGTAGYRIDLGIRHPTEPGRFLLGVECDGAAYHSSRVARDRDRLRQEVLEGLGWRVHRIWGPAWYRDRAGQERRLRAAIQEAAAARDLRAPGSEATAPPRPTTAAALDGPPRWSIPYRTCRPDLGGARANPTDVAEWDRLQAVVNAIVKVEAPIRVGLLARRVGQVWDCNVTARVRDAVDRAVSALTRAGSFQLEGDVVRLPGASGEQQVRVPDPGDEATRRDITDIPPHELRLAVRLLLADARSVDEEELLARIRSLFGFDRTGARIRSALEEALQDLVQDGIAGRGTDGMLRVR
jgi:very-short-patch-repair endonuclease